MYICIPPDPEEMNERRSGAAEQALLSFAEDIGETEESGGLGALAEQNISDLLADLAHYCDRRGLKLKKCLAQARLHYVEETGGQGAQFRRPSNRKAKVP